MNGTFNVLVAAIAGFGSASVSTSTAPMMTVATVVSNLSFSDERPISERKNKALSSWITSCDFNVQNIGDEGVYKSHIGKGRIADLESKLNLAFSKSTSPHVIILKRYRFVFNAASAGLADSVGTALGGGGLAPLIADGKTRKAKCEKNKMSAGWFDSSEITNNNSPFIIEIEMIVDSKAVSFRKVYSPTFELMKHGVKPEMAIEIERLISSCNEQTVALAVATGT